MGVLTEYVNAEAVKEGWSNLLTASVYATIYDCYQVGCSAFQKLWTPKGGSRNTYKKALNPPPNRVLKTKAKLIEWVSSPEFRNQLAITGWNEDLGRELLLANIQGRRLAESKAILDKYQNQQKGKRKEDVPKTIKQKSRRLSNAATERPGKKGPQKGSAKRRTRPKA